MPLSLLDNHEELKIATKHELQHLRQHDGWFRHLLAIINIFCWWNPLYHTYTNWLFSLQEYACDEALTANKQLSTKHYAKILLAIAKKTSSSQRSISLHIAAGIFGNNIKPQQLKRRIHMLSKSPKRNNRRLVLGVIFILAIANSLIAFAINAGHGSKPLSQQKLAQMVANLPDNQLNIQANDQVLKALNTIISNPKTRAEFKAGLQRMTNYQPEINAQLTAKKLPTDLLAVPLLESRYQPLAATKHLPNVAGIWQISAPTAKHYGIKVNSNVDERLQTKPATNVALLYLSDEHARFKSWPLAIVSYDAGAIHTQKLMQTAGTRDAWKAIAGKNVMQEIKQYLPMIDASVIIMHNPKLVE